MRAIAIEPRFHARYVVTDNGCWQWTAKLMSHGYAEISWNGQRWTAHRVSYLLHKGDIPEGCEIDHLCGNRACVNPDHLEAVPHRVNSARGNLKRRKTHCKNGHPLSGENLLITAQGRWCRACNNRRSKEWAEANRERSNAIKYKWKKAHA